MRTREEWTQKILEDLEAGWKHADAINAIPTAIEARGMVEKSCAMILTGEMTTLGEAIAHCVLTLIMVRETAMADEQERAEAS